MLALETGWTPDVLAELPLPFVDACRWALYARAIAGPEGFPSVEIPRTAPIAARLALLQQKVAVDEHRRLLFPEDDDG